MQPYHSSVYPDDFSLTDTSTALGNLDYSSPQGPWSSSPQYSSNTLGLIGTPSALPDGPAAGPHDSHLSPSGHGPMFYMSPISATPQTSLHATRLEHPPIRIFTESLHDFSPAEDPRSPLRLQRSPVDASPSALLTPAQSSYTASSPSNNGSVPPITPLSPYNHLYFATPLIRPSSQSPLSLAGGSISPTALTFKEEQSSLSMRTAQQEQTVRRVLDFAYVMGYPLQSEPVPQPDYKPHTQSDRRRYVEQVDLEAPILFWTHSPEALGISLKEAFCSRFMKLVDRDDPMFEGRGPSVSIRLNVCLLWSLLSPVFVIVLLICVAPRVMNADLYVEQWPGYPPWSRQIPTRDFRSPPQPVTRAKLARNVAKTIKRFIEDMESRDLEDPSQSKWRVGKNGIRLDDLVLVGLQHVSMGSWQAHLRVVHRRH
ncbi:hypothetical protein C8Q70DRAFT_255596 [Cubamyces menziesii]|nr:hypothetical protein C8Q70DRAFT_255596 [Cubamyces menziesii]